MLISMWTYLYRTSHPRKWSTPQLSAKNTHKKPWMKCLLRTNHYKSRPEATVRETSSAGCGRKPLVKRFRHIPVVIAVLVEAPMVPLRQILLKYDHN